MRCNSVILFSYDATLLVRSSSKRRNSHSKSAYLIKWRLDVVNIHFIKGLNPAVRPAGHLCSCAWAARDHRDPVESQHRWSSAGRFGPVSGEEEPDRWTGGRPYLQPPLSWVIDESKQLKMPENQNKYVWFHIINCHLTLRLLLCFNFTALINSHMIITANFVVF